ncbi:MAG TPA: hypothetical protein VIN71_13395 [Pseudomonadales bacterium]
MKIRTLHRYVAIVMAPFLLLLSLTGGLLFFRKTDWYGKELKELLVGIHTWEIVAPYVGLLVGAGLLFLVISGVILFFNRRA